MGISDWAGLGGAEVGHRQSDSSAPGPEIWRRKETGPRRDSLRGLKLSWRNEWSQN